MADMGQTENRRPHLFEAFDKLAAVRQETPREEALARMPEKDRENLVRITQAFTPVMQERHLRGALVLVGGALTKPFPRKDIDVRMIIDTGEIPEDLGDEYSLALKKYQTTKSILGDMAKRVQRVVVKEAVGPQVLHDHPNQLEHEGTLIVEAEGATPIEFMNTLSGNVQEFVSNQTGEFSFLATA